MRAEHDVIEGPFAIAEDLTLHGTIVGDATLQQGVRFILHGTIAGNLTVKAGSRALIHGTVSGRIYNDGGRVEVFGICEAVENLAPDAVSIILPTAHVRRGRVNRRRGV